MKSVNILVPITSVVLMCIYGCSDSAQNSGYLSDYSQLQSTSGTIEKTISGPSYLYRDQKTYFGQYKSFIIDPVVVHYEPDSKAVAAVKKGQLTKRDVNDLTTYFYSAIIDAINDSGYKIAYRAGEGVARIRVAITDLRKTNIVFAAVPTARVTTGIGVGGAGIESEMVDSVSGKQLKASVESKEGSRIPFTGLSDWGGAKYAMDEWVSRFKKQLREMKENS